MDIPWSSRSQGTRKNILRMLKSTFIVVASSAASLAGLRSCTKSVNGLA